ncbi:MAG TPA: glycoside hydrolase family 2 TIM barrel-domain containing protein [Streptosporangiaceae bacterium]
MKKPGISRRSVLAGGAVGAAAALLTLTGQHEDAVAEPGERSHDFNRDWLFGGRYVSGAERPAYDDRHFARVTLPHTVTDLSWNDWDFEAWEHVWIYRKHLDGAAVTGGRVLLTFDGVMTNTVVVLNGKTVGSHIGGYLPLTVELTEHLRKKGDNVLAVIVDAHWLNVPPDGAAAGPLTMDYLQPGGIYRDAVIRVVPDIYLEDVFARPENVLTNACAVNVQATVNAAIVPKDGAVTVTAVLLDGTRTLATATTTHHITAAGSSTVGLRIGDFGPVDHWSPDNPRLYTVKTTVAYAGGQHKEHTRTSRIGFREAVFKPDGFYLNGGRYKIFGLNRHQMFPYLGMAAPARLQRRDAEILKYELNCNMVRCSHYPQSPHFLDACDELGIMIWEEPPGWQHVGNMTFEEQVLRDVRDMVIRDRNRPSVIVWATRLDETANYPGLYARAREIAYQYDGSRPTAGAVTFHTKTRWAEDIFSYDDYHDVAGMPQLLPPVAGTPYLVSESVGALHPTYRWFDPPEHLARQALAHALVHEQAQANPRYAGLLAWAGFDYYSGSGGNPLAVAKNWHTLRTPGVVDTFRVPKPAAAIYRSQVDPARTPVIVPTFFWDSGVGSGGPGRDCMFATNCDRLEIYVGGKHLATAHPDRKRFGHLAYPPVFADLSLNDRLSPGHAVRPTRPELRVDGYVGPTLAATLLMSADTSRDRLVLTADDTAITADGSDATRITFRVTDAYGNQRPYATGDVTLSLSGPGVLVGRNPFPLERYGGAGGGFVRSVPGAAGRVTVTARHARLGVASVVVTTAINRSVSFL